MWQCRSPRRSSTVTSRGGLEARRELPAVLAQLRRDPRQAEPLVDLLLGRAAQSSRRSRRRGSRTRRRAGRGAPPPRAARRCARAEPVKCWSRLPNWSGSTTRRSMPQAVVRAAARARSRPAEPADSMHVDAGQRGGERGRVGRGGDDVEVLHRVRHAGARSRRSRPAPRRGARAARPRPASPTASARGSTMRCGGLVGGAGLERGEHALLELRARSPSRRAAVPVSAASRSASSESIPSWSYIARTRFGPTPGRRVIAARPGGMRSRSFPSAGIVPVSTIARIFSSSVLPIPGQRRDACPRARARRRRPSRCARSSRPCGRPAPGGRPRRPARRDRRARRTPSAIAVLERSAHADLP